MASIQLKDVTVDFPVYDKHKELFIPLVNKIVPISRTGGGIHVNSGGKAIVRALAGISLDIKDGDRFGLVGLNGAGKTTLLRVLAGIYEPSLGEITINGKVSPLFNISLGMDLDDTGYENIINVGQFLGMGVKEARSRIPEIEEFTELGKFLSLPVRTYSSGMMVRLSFAIATSINPEILLLDEGLGAGDMVFAEKAKKRVEELISRTSIMILASHSDALVKQMCNKGILLEKGRVLFQGDIDDVIKYYHEHIDSLAAAS